ncbi:MAG: class I SAM-dependent RNA methyltransferase [Candidatus Nanopelagicales bacterium]
MTLVVGDVVELELERPAHGGYCVGRVGGQVVFARHGVPGERARVEITEIGSGNRFARGDVREVLLPSPDRIRPACPHAGPGKCGGCDWQHVTLVRQRAMKAEIIREQMLRIGHLDPQDPLLADVVVQACGDDRDGFGYRTRMDFVADARGRLGLRAARSHDIIALQQCPLAVTAINESEAWHQPWRAGATIRLAASRDGVTVAPDAADAPTVHEQVGDLTYEVAADGFWQVHRNAAKAFTELAHAMLQPRPGEFLLDLYGGVGLFACALAEHLGAGGRLMVVESDRRAGRLARRNLRRFANAEVIVERVDRWLRERMLSRVDLVIVDPPRAGAGKEVMAEVLRLRPRALLYVSCDPASLARDIAFARDLGYLPSRLQAIDAFPQTSHIESFALLIPSS